MIDHFDALMLGVALVGTILALGYYADAAAILMRGSQFHPGRLSSTRCGIGSMLCAAVALVLALW